MQYKDIKKLNVNNRFKKFDTYAKKQLPAIKAQSLEFGQLIPPILAWGNEVVYGAPYVELVKEHPTLECTVLFREYENWKQAEADITTYVCTMEELTPWDKLVLAVSCEDYWYQVDLARQNQGKRTDLDTDSESKLKPQKVNQIIGEKVGVSATVVSNFKTIYNSGRKDLIRECEQGMAITTAYNLLKLKKDKLGKKSDKPDGKASTQIEVMRNCKIFEECEKLPPSKKKVAGTHKAEDYKVIVDKIAHTKLPAGRIWVALDRNKGTLHVASKTSDEAAGKVQVKVDSFDCQFKESVDGLYIFEADFIFGPEQYNRKDETEFNKTIKTDTMSVLSSEEVPV